MRISPLWFACLAVGCMRSDPAEVLTRPSSEWTRIECDAVIRKAMAHNVPDKNAAIRIFATPYSPSVVTALTRKEQILKGLSEKEFQKSFDQMARETLGLYYDWYSSAYYDARGNFYRSRLQLDSLLFLVTIENKTYPCAIPFPIVSHRTLAELLDWPCYTPMLADLENRIYLTNDRGDRVVPRYIWGRKGTQLMKDETLFIMFSLHAGSEHMLDGTENLYMVIRGFGDDVRLTFPVSVVK